VIRPISDDPKVHRMFPFSSGDIKSESRFVAEKNIKLNLHPRVSGNGKWRTQGPGTVLSS
jgi:hypothetical protein